MSESRPTLSELGAQIPPGIQNLIMFLEETLIKGRIAPLEAKLTLLERKVDGYTSEIVEKAIDSAIRSAYNTISDEMCMMVKSEVEKGVREALKAYFMEMEGIKKEMEECRQRGERNRKLREPHDRCQARRARREAGEA